jgi:hypothetical protein
MSDKQTTEIEKSAATQKAAQGASENVSQSKETKVTTSADGGTVTTSTVTKVVSSGQQESKELVT